MTPGGTSGVPTAPSRMASNAAQLVERRVGEDLAVAQVALAAEVELGRVERDAGRPEDLDRLGGDLRSDAVAADDGDAMRCALGHGRSS